MGIECRSGTKRREVELLMLFEKFGRTVRYGTIVRRNLLAEPGYGRARRGANTGVR